jgi:DNA invertase Pin-like site-specific DNA recombinase
MNVVIYARSNIEAEEYRQIHHCAEFAKEKGYRIIGIATTEQEVERMVLQEDVRAVIVVHPSRISRSLSEYSQIKKTLNNFGAKIIIAEGYEARG